MNHVEHTLRYSTGQTAQPMNPVEHMLHYSTPPYGGSERR
jgi:hypothetical protein